MEAELYPPLQKKKVAGRMRILMGGVFRKERLLGLWMLIETLVPSTVCCLSCEIAEITSESREPLT